MKKLHAVGFIVNGDKQEIGGPFLFCDYHVAAHFIEEQRAKGWNQSPAKIMRVVQNAEIKGYVAWLQSRGLVKCLGCSGNGQWIRLKVAPLTLADLAVPSDSEPTTGRA
jgi:hypothetical protein